MNTIQNGTFSVIHSNTTADFTNNMYGAVYCNATTSIVVNGTTIACQQGQIIPIIVKSDGTTLSGNFLLLGNPKPAGLEKTGKISGSTYQWIDIKTGLPIQQS
jgi:hypothetical protein